MLHVRKLSLSEIKAIHETHMPEAFPPRELRPYSSIKALYEGGNYMGYGLFEDEKLAAYAYFAKADRRPFALLDYFAVLPALRGNGLGSRFFTLLCAELEAIDGLLLEVESVESAPDESQRAVRRRRIAFYIALRLRDDRREMPALRRRLQHSGHAGRRGRCRRTGPSRRASKTSTARCSTTRFTGGSAAATGSGRA